ncbi:Holliday junction resolvase MOC1, chloroplastic isoform X2 [Physcomitrium patens]|uniref:Uncharacterized protein n=1 Tax=Physcomitrium patens TaxID=3218 RepID=A0A7I4CIH3_PHYPA|nr:Holliday junction resolvase MOC1, chloroplastic-like isoform X2 [Physcomitrium patens]|eukprot:XP_024361951.1 Holliday junction resolvase MOC1, chloroplastic-like isoform X2 [Physcomitrella patens]
MYMRLFLSNPAHCTCDQESVETMIRGGFWRRVAIARTAIATGRITSSTVSSVSLGTIHGIFESQQKGTARLCACLKGRVFADNRLCRGDSSTIDKSSLNDPMVVRFCVSPTGVGNNSRHSWVTRGIRIAAEVELKEGETAQLPEELGESLESESWSVGLDGLNGTVVPSNACILGIDPDASGAIAVLRDGTQEVLDVPCVKIQVGKTMRRRHDARSIVDLVNKINAPEGSVAYVEQAMPFPMDGKQGWYGCGFGYGMWVGILMALGFKVVPVRAQVWKSAMGIAGKQYTKDDSRATAMALFPDLGPQLKRKKDHGRADAILIAAFGKGLSPPPKISDQEVGLIQEECPF